MNNRTSPGHPEGLREEHSAPPSGFARHASPLSLALLAALMVIALTGVLGGYPKPVLVATAEAARLEVKTPAVIRNGEFFETEIRIAAGRPIGDLVIGVSPQLWRDITINTMIPAPAEEKYEAGFFRFSYGPLEPGTALVVKIDGQINPSLLRGTGGRVMLFDGKRPITAIPVDMRVLP